MACAAPSNAALPSVDAAPLCSTERAHTALVQVLRLLPQDARARAACVCRAWRDAAADPALWLALRFDDCTAKLNDEELARLCVRAGAGLRDLRLDAPACGAVTAAGAAAALRKGGCAAVQRLVLRTQDWWLAADALNAEQVQELAAACPALQHAQCLVRCGSPVDVATACALLPGPLTLFVHRQLDAARAVLLLPARVAAVVVRKCTLDAIAMGVLGDALRTSTSLTTITLDGCHVGDAGAAALGAALRTNASLQTLSVWSSDLGNAGAAALGEALRVNRTLAALNLEANRIGDAGAASLGEALRANSALLRLSLWGNNIGNAGAAALTEALRLNTTLTKLALNGGNLVKPTRSSDDARAAV